MRTITTTLACVAAGAAALVGATTADAASFVNGDFETCTPNCPTNTTPLSGGSGQLTGWTVSSGNGGNASQAVQWVTSANGGWNAYSGAYSIALSGGYEGTVSQTIATQVGAIYDVSFEVAGNPKNLGLMKDLGVELNGGSFEQFQFVDASTSGTNMAWVKENYTFTATTGETTLSFFNYNPNVNHVGNKLYGIALDDVQIQTVAVPEPATWAMMILGVAGLGGMARTRRRTALAA
jgi:choice-of-anchor C domain-containing protein